MDHRDHDRLRGEPTQASTRDDQGKPHSRDPGHTVDTDHAGHTAHADHPDHAAHDKHAGHSPAMFRDRFWTSLILTLPVLYFSEQVQALLGYQAVRFPGVAWVNPVLGTVLFLYGGLVFLRGARIELADRRPGMMTLISLAITVAYGYSMAVALGAPGMPFFWELATLITIMLLGHWLEMASIQGASRALEELTKLLPTVAHRLGGAGAVEDVPVSALRVGDRILVRPGEQVPADGDVEDGASSVNEAFLTGESRPVTKAPGDEVIAASVNGEGALTVTVSRTGDQTTLSQIQRLVAEAQSSRSRFQALADRAAGWLFYVALGAGALTLVAWLVATQDVQEAITRMVTVLVIACPHALGLAIPLVTVNATAMSASTGILVRNREAFERARAIRTVAFDKTGTLTEGAFGVRQVYTDALGEADALRIAAALEARSEHPLASAVVEAYGASAARESGGTAASAEASDTAEPGAAQAGLPASSAAAVNAVEAFEVVAGKGVRGRVDGTAYTVGRPEWIAEQGLAFPDALKRGLAEAEGRGESVIALMDDRRALALFALADQVRDSAREAVRALKRLGVEAVMITGDSEPVARTVAADLGILSFHARVLPQEKAGLVAGLKRGGPTAFVGDGINDAPALLAADLGIAVGAGTNVAIESADLVLVEDDPLDVVAALQLSRATYRKMVENLFWATGYNVVALPLAAGVLAWAGVVLSPAVGALLMSLSTVIVAGNAMLLRRTKLGAAAGQ